MNFYYNTSSDTALSSDIVPAPGTSFYIIVKPGSSYGSDFDVGDYINIYFDGVLTHHCTPPTYTMGVAISSKNGVISYTRNKITVPENASTMKIEARTTQTYASDDGEEVPDTTVYGSETLTFNKAPTAPETLIIGSPAAGKLMAVDWTASTDDDGDEITYCVEYDFDSSGVWTQAGQTTGLTLPILIPSDGGYGTIAVRVKAMDTKGGESGYTTSEAMTISYNTAPVISGEDTSLGSLAAPPVYTYTVTDPDDGQTITVTEKIVTADGTDHVLHTYTADSGAQNTFAWTALGWLICQNGINTLVITATDGTETVQRRVTFQRQVNEISAARAVSTDAMPAKVLLSLYPSPATLPGDCTIEAYVTNNPFDTEPVWEDVSERLNIAVHTFANSTCANGYGIGYRFKITKGESKIYFDTAVLRFA